MKCYIVDKNSKVYGEAKTFEQADKIVRRLIQKWLDRGLSEDEIDELELEVIKC